MERKLSVAQRIRSLRRWSPRILVSFPCSSKSKFTFAFSSPFSLRLVLSVNIINSKDYKTPFLFPLLFRRPQAKVCVVSRGISKEAEQNTVTAQPCRCADVPGRETQSIGTKINVCVREGRERERLERARERWRSR